GRTWEGARSVPPNYLVPEFWTWRLPMHRTARPSVCGRVVHHERQMLRAGPLPLSIACGGGKLVAGQASGASHRIRRQSGSKRDAPRSDRSTAQRPPPADKLHPYGAGAGEVMNLQVRIPILTDSNPGCP